MADDTNLAIWERLGKTDPAHTKKFQRGGGFKGTAIKPIYTTQKMTEEFGPAGKGWGMGEPSFQIVPGSEGQIAVFCTVSLWWQEPQNVVYGVGGDMVVIKQSAGLRTDDEAFKKAFTDAIGNAMKHLGMSADVHMGLFDDSKYVREVAAEFADDERQPKRIDRNAVPLEDRPEAPNDGYDPKASKQTPNGMLKKDERELDGDMRKEILDCPTVDELNALWRSPSFVEARELLSEQRHKQLEEYAKEHARYLRNRPAAIPQQQAEAVQ